MMAVPQTTPTIIPLALDGEEIVGLGDGELMIDDEGRTVVTVGFDVVVAADVIEKRLVARKAMRADATCWTCAHTVKLLYNQ
jgi:hypothetical protein